MSISTLKKPDATIDGVGLYGQKHKRIVLIGCTGHGKGTFGNFLYNLGQTAPNHPPLPFGTSGELKPDTQDPYSLLLPILNSPNAPDRRKNQQLLILDTPGLNDIGRKTDLQHMINVLRMIGKTFHSVNLLVLVYRFKTRADAAVGPALRYYRDLFAPLFRNKNVILVLTQVSSDDFEDGIEKGTWETDVKNHLEQVNKLLELDRPPWNCPIVRCFYVNSKWTNTKIDKFLKGITPGKAFDKTDLLYRSYLMREQILDYILEASEVILDTHLLPLPPSLETERSSALTVINRRIAELLKTVSVEDEHRSVLLTTVDQLRTELTRITNEINMSIAKVDVLSADQKTPSTNVAGDDWIRFLSAGEYSVNAPCQKSSECGGCHCVFKYRSHNASHPYGYPMENNRTWTVKINPNFICITQKEQRYWYYEFWLEYSGVKHNATAIEQQIKIQQELQEKKMKIANEVKEAEKRLESGEAKLTAHKRNLNKLCDDKSILQPKYFNISDIDLVLGCMEKNMQPH